MLQKSGNALYPVGMTTHRQPTTSSAGGAEGNPYIHNTKKRETTKGERERARGPQPKGLKDPRHRPIRAVARPCSPSGLMTKARYTTPAYPPLSSLLHSKKHGARQGGKPSGFSTATRRARGRWETMEDAKRMQGLSTGSASVNECEQLSYRNEGFPKGKAVVQAVHALVVWAGKLFIRG